MTDLFATGVSTAIRTLSPILTERGDQYGDSWTLNQWTTLKAVLKKLGISLPKETKHTHEELLRILGAAAMVDIKYSRNASKIKDDNLIDGSAYTLFLEDLLKKYDGPRPTCPQLPDYLCSKRM